MKVKLRLVEKRNGITGERGRKRKQWDLIKLLSMYENDVMKRIISLNDIYFWGNNYLL